MNLSIRKLMIPILVGILFVCFAPAIQINAEAEQTEDVPISSIEFEPVRIAQWTNGRFYLCDENTEKRDWYYYYIYNYNYTVKFSDGTPDLVHSDEDDQSGFYYQDKYVNVKCSIEQDEFNELQSGVHTVNVSVGEYETTYEFEIVEIPIETIELEPITAIERTNRSGKYSPDGTYRYTYDDYNPTYNVKFSDGTPDKNDSTEGYIDWEFEYDGLDVWLNFDSYQDDENPWTPGTYEVTVRAGGYTTTYDYTILPTPVTDIKYDPVVVIENSCGDSYTQADDAGNIEEYYIYDANRFFKEFIITIDGKDVAIDTKGHDSFYYEGTSYWPIFFDSQVWEGIHWKAGNTYPVTGWIMGYVFEFDVKVIEMPVASAEIETLTYTAGTNGTYHVGYDADADVDYKYFHYEIEEDIPSYSLTLKNGETVYSEADGRVKIDGAYFTPEIDLQQTYKNPWGLGTHTCKLTVAGYETEYTVNIVCDHEWGNGTITKSPTCTQVGTIEYTCTVDGCTETKTEILPIDADAHQWDATFTEDKAATCTQQGSKSIHCQLCTATTQTTATPLAAHTERVLPAKAATCTKTGRTEGKQCEFCGIILVSQNELPMVAHEEINLDKMAATCTTNGLTEGKQCAKCGRVTQAQREIPALGHNLKTLKAKAATCTKTGLTSGKKCSVCGTITQKQQKVEKLPHVAKTKKITKATRKKNGSITRKCKCGVVVSKKKIKRVSTIKLSQSVYIYNGKMKSPKIIVQDSDGKTLKKNKDYTVVKPKGRKQIGTYTYKIKLKGNYKGKKNLKLTIKELETPLTPAIGKISSKKKSVTIKWKAAADATGYYVYAREGKKGAYKKVKTIYNQWTTSFTHKKLKRGKSYFYKVQAFNKQDGATKKSKKSAFVAIVAR